MYSALLLVCIICTDIFAKIDFSKFQFSVIEWQESEGDEWRTDEGNAKLSTMEKEATNERTTTKTQTQMCVCESGRGQLSGEHQRSSGHRARH